MAASILVELLGQMSAPRREALVQARARACRRLGACHSPRRSAAAQCALGACCSRARVRPRIRSGRSIGSSARRLHGDVEAVEYGRTLPRQRLGHTSKTRPRLPHIFNAPQIPATHGRSTTWRHLYLDGRGVAHDSRRAYAYYMKAAAQGHERAMNLVGRCCEEGWGTARDVPRRRRMVSAFGRGRLFSRPIQLGQHSAYRRALR